MIHLYLKINSDYCEDLYYASENVREIRIITDKYNMKTVFVDDKKYENVLDVVVENI